ncbi:MAG TPA: SCO family protein [Micropepsaceae bacterium]|nr:SCO family protein [Micropepsaceae bacterium]
MKRLSLAGVALFLVVALIIGGLFWRIGSLHSQTETAAAATPAGDFGGPFSLTDQNGTRRTDTDFRGKYMLIFFGYTYCPDICPTMLAVEAEALDKLGSRAGQITPIFVSVDPKRDTPNRLKSYLSAFDAKPRSARPDFVGLTGSGEDIAKAANAYRVYYRAHLDGQTEDGADYSVDHTTEVYLMDPAGKFVAYYSEGISPDEMAADLKKNIR